MSLTAQLKIRLRGLYVSPLRRASSCRVRPHEKEPPPEMQEMMQEMDALTVGEIVYFDLKDPWLHAPR